ncbi:MAG: GAF domain-containing protein [Acidobacteria bacterium]|nr:GAF domain-containing protein [Acidobacteriota bacterium]
MSETYRDNLADEAVSAEAAPAPAGTAPELEAGCSEADAISCLAQVVEELNSSLELDAVLQQVATRVKQFIDYDTFGIHLLDPLGQELRIRFGIGYPPEVMQHWRLGLGQGLVGTVAKTREPLRVGNVKNDPRYISAGEGICSEMAIPLVVKSRPVGVLDVGSRRCDAFTETHQRMLTFLAGHLANAIENARLYENLREQARTLSLLHEVSRELTAILDREELLRRVAQRVKRLVDYHGFHVMLWNEETQLLENAFSLRFDERLAIKAGLPMGVGICGTAAALRQPVRVPNVHLDPRYVTCGDAVDVHSELVVPLVVKDRLIGVLDLESTEYNAFTEQHEQLLSTLTSYIAIAFENARLYEKVREGERRLEMDLEMARDIQRRLLPEAPPRFPGLDIAIGYVPARQLGGDVFDFLPYADGRLGVAVGDVAGKATAAALYGSLAIGILRGHVVEHPCEPAEMLELMNEYLRKPRIDNRFMALAFALYDPRSKVLTVANAGFPRPALIRGGRLEEIEVDGVPLGILPDIRYEEKKLALQDGDVIVFCSDGIHECLDKSGKEFGLGCLREMLVELAPGSAQEIAQGVLQATDRYAAGNGGAADDRTIVVLKVARD